MGLLYHVLCGICVFVCMVFVSVLDWYLFLKPVQRTGLYKASTCTHILCLAYYF